MKLDAPNYGFTGSLPENRMGAKIKTSAKLFDILSAGIYADPILAPIRELCCNAYDSHVEAGVPDEPFTVVVPNYLEHTFAVEDYGTGIPPDRFQDIFYTYGESTKTGSNSLIGALGLGSKSPFAYTKSSYIVRNRYEGMEYTYLCFINEVGEPDGSLTSSAETDEPNGVRIEFAVRSSDVYPFRERISTFFRYWQATMPNFVGATEEDLDIREIKTILEGTRWFIEGDSRRNHALAMMGNVPYKIDADSIPNLPTHLRVIAVNPFIITFPMGALNFAASREGLKYDERTTQSLIARFQEVHAEIKSTFWAKLKKSANQLEFITSFESTFSEFRRVINSYSAGQSISSSSVPLYTELLLGKSPRDTVEFDGVKYVIEELVTGTITVKVPRHSAFALIQAEARGKSSRKYMCPKTTLEYTSVDEVPYSLFNSNDVNGDDGDGDEVMAAGHVFSSVWRDSTVTRKHAKQAFDIVLENSELFTARTIHSLKIGRCKQVTFVINDVGSGGGTRFKLLSERASSVTYFLVDWNHRVGSLDEVKKELEQLIGEGFTGAEIKKLSDLPDLRAPVQKQQTTPGQLKVKYLELKPSKPTALAVRVAGETIEVKKVGGYQSNTGPRHHVERVVSVSDLQQLPLVLYLVKRRSPKNIFDNFTSKTPSVICNHDLQRLAGHYGFFDGAENSAGNIEVLILNEGQASWLKKHGVKLESYRDLIVKKINDLQVAEKFKESVEEHLSLSQVEVVTRFYNFAKPEQIKEQLALLDPSPFREALEKFHSLKSHLSLMSDAFAKTWMLMTVTSTEFNRGDEVAEKIIDELHAAYPLLKHVPLSYNAIQDVLDYINGIDRQKALT